MNNPNSCLKWGSSAFEMPLKCNYFVDERILEEGHMAG
jgi:hypothetical protein